MSEALQPRRSDLAFPHHDHPPPADPLLDLKEEPDGTHSQKWIDIKSSCNNASPYQQNPQPKSANMIEPGPAESGQQLRMDQIDCCSQP